MNIGRYLGTYVHGHLVHGYIIHYWYFFIPIYVSRTIYHENDNIDFESKKFRGKISSESNLLFDKTKKCT